MIYFHVVFNYVSKKLNNFKLFLIVLIFLLAFGSIYFFVVQKKKVCIGWQEGRDVSFIDSLNMLDYTYIGKIPHM